MRPVCATLLAILCAPAPVKAASAVTLVLGLALVFGVREIINLRRYDRQRAARNAAESKSTEE